MTRYRSLLFAAAAAAALVSAQAFAQGAAPSPEAFPPYVADTSSHPVTGQILIQSGRIHEGRSSAYVPSIGTTNTDREGQVQSF